MIASELINSAVACLNIDDSVGEAIDKLEDSGQIALAVINEDSKYLGIAEESMLLHLDSERKLAQVHLKSADFSVQPNDHFFQLLRSVQQHDLPIIPVTDFEGVYLGTVLVSDIAIAIAKGFSIQTPGGIVVLSVAEKDYSLSELARLVESNGLKVLNSFVEKDDLDPLKLRVTLKLNQMDAARSIATFERFGYVVLEKYQQTDMPDTDRDRLNQLFRIFNL